VPSERTIAYDEDFTKSHQGDHIMQRRLLAGAVFGMLLLCTSVARADEGSKQEISVQGTGFFTKDATSTRTTTPIERISQHRTNSGGLLVSYRYHFNGWLGADVSYGYTRNSEKDLVTTGAVVSPGLGPGPVQVTAPFNIQSNVHQATGALLVSVPVKPFHLSPYVLAGAGALIFAPTGGARAFVPGASSQAKPAFVWGGGVDYGVGRHVAVRLEYRGFVYQHPSQGLIFLNSGASAYTSQPSAGVVFRF
jgi:opacity protein-like surface antigen